METINETLPFDKRYGYEPINVPFQFEALNEVTRIELWNAFYIYIHQTLEKSYSNTKDYLIIYRYLWIHYFRKPYDEFTSDPFLLRQLIKNYIEKEIWYNVFVFFEFIFPKLIELGFYQVDDFIEFIDTKLEDNNSAYRIINYKFVPITNDIEISEIKVASINAEKFNLNGIQEHLNSALQQISNKPDPDYRLSIKESICMVECIARKIEPSSHTLGKALQKLQINQKLKNAFEKLYEYTNDKNGIRHAIMNEEIVNAEDAKFFLVACSAFTNFLIEKARKENLLPESF